MEKENVVIIFGGKSTEHDISIITGLQVLSNIDKRKYNAIPVYIDKLGSMYTGDVLEKISTYVNFSRKNKNIKQATFVTGVDVLFVSKNKEFHKSMKQKKEQILNKLVSFKPIIKIDCAIVCCHGVNGEDGTLQGLLELSNIPYTSPGVLASALSMDKIAMKDVFVANDILTAKYTYFNKGEYLIRYIEVIDKIENKLRYPMFVKPANLGSSIGISKCRNRKELEQGIEIAINYDSRILVEESIEENIELNCAVLGNVDYQLSSLIEYPKTWSDFLSFEEKYIQRGKSSEVEIDVKNKGKKENSQHKIDKVSIKLPTEVEEQVQEMAKNVFKIFDCSGVVRIDFLIKKEEVVSGLKVVNKIYVNEINTIPGSLAFYLFKDKGYTFKELLNRVIDIAKKEKERRDNNKLSYQSSALVKFKEGQKLNKNRV